MRQHIRRWHTLLLLILVGVVSSDSIAWCSLNQSIAIQLLNGQHVSVPVSLDDALSGSSIARINDVLSPQFYALCMKLLVDHTTDSCVAGALSSLHTGIRSACASTIGTNITKSCRVPWRSIVFSGPDSRLPKVFPCNFVGDLSASVLNYSIRLPLALSVSGDGGAPLKSFAQALSVLRPSFRSSCHIIVNEQKKNDAADSLLFAECMKQMQRAFEDGALEKCEVVAATTSSTDDFEADEVYCTDGHENVQELHLRFLAGDELEHYYHFMLAEVLPVVSAIQQVFAAVPTAAFQLKVVLHNSLRPWGQSPLHAFYTDIENGLTALFKLRARGSIDGIPSLKFVYSNDDDPSAYLLPRWDYDCEEADDQQRLSDAADILAASMRLLHNPDKEDTRTAKSLDLVIQERTTDPALEAFYKRYFCDLIDRGVLGSYVPRHECGVYGKQRRHVMGLEAVAARFRGSDGIAGSTDLAVALEAPDGDAPLRLQIQPFINASVMVLGHGGGMAHALFMRAHAGGSVIEITGAAKHAEMNGAARGLRIIAAVRGLHWRRIVCTSSVNGSSGEDTESIAQVFTAEDMLHGDLSDRSVSESIATQSTYVEDVADTATPCGALLQKEISLALRRAQTGRRAREV